MQTAFLNKISVLPPSATPSLSLISSTLGLFTQWTLILQTLEEIQYILGGISSHTFAGKAKSSANGSWFDREPLIFHTKVWKTFKQTYEAVWIFQIILQHSRNSASSSQWCIKHRLWCPRTGKVISTQLKNGAHDVWTMAPSLTRTWTTVAQKNPNKHLNPVGLLYVILTTQKK